MLLNSHGTLSLLSAPCFNPKAANAVQSQADDMDHATAVVFSTSLKVLGSWADEPDCTCVLTEASAQVRRRSPQGGGTEISSERTDSSLPLCG